MKIQYSIVPYTGRPIFIVSFILFCFTSFSQNIDFGKSYVNITKGLNGGTVEPGDTLEIRASIVVKSGTYDSCGYFDAVPAGTSYIPGTIRVLTNEGKIFRQFTDAAGDDPGWISGTNVRINLGFSTTNPATAFRRGRIANTYKPSFYNNTCIMIASFRVVVIAGYNSMISMGGGSMTYKSTTTGSVLTTFTYPGRTIAIFKNYGICPNAVGANSIGTEFNGTFGSGQPRNRGTSANVPTGYTYSPFTSNMPNDYYYGIANNTSINTGYTTTNSWPIPDNTHRVFGAWDIIGDHTGATDPLLGNPPADTVANPNGGYMLVINAAYRIDSAFQQTISGLCPNTYYEISCWVRNICSRCGCDSNGKGASSTGYIPTAPKDSSGVRPNLSFNVDGVDYYSSGNILYTGQWVKKGFTFLTGPNQTSFTLKFFNNAPGGGGNDWALDDISVATCSPNLAFTPNNNPSICTGNTVDLGAYIRSYFNNYTYYKWQKSTDNGMNWTDAGPVSTGTPAWNGSNWEYYTKYPTFVATQADSGTKFRVVVASTAGNITNANCSFADVTSVLTLNVLNCGTPMATDILSFSGKLQNSTAILNWTTSREEQPVKYTIEKSTDGRTFSQAATINARQDNREVNYYTWSEPYTGQAVYYRIRLNSDTKQKISRIVRISASEQKAVFTNVPNPFHSNLVAEVSISDAQVINLQLIDNLGKILKKQQYTLTGGNNLIALDNTDHLPSGIYTLQLITSNEVISKRVLKQ